MLTKWFPGMDIRDMNLNKRNSYTKQRIPNRNASMRKRTGVNQHDIDFAPGLMQSIDDGAFVVRLEAFQNNVLGAGEGLRGFFHLGESCWAVDVWLAGAEEV